MLSSEQFPMGTRLARVILIVCPKSYDLRLMWLLHGLTSINDGLVDRIGFLGTSD